MILNKKILNKINNEIKKYPINKKKSALISALIILQENYGWLSKKLQKKIAKYINIPYISVLEIITFYKMYNLKPQGKYKITICTSLSCVLSGANKIKSYLIKKLKINFNETTLNKKITLINGECIGTCGKGPVILVNNKYIYNNITKKKINKLLKKEFK
ncbi:NADH-quinone oxidoreductase subunit NuoE [Candidatus Zinderia endosymbiont of Aphrophora alni]|uniref:NADH-quinone oxidoreductase subunit NuoE family protein n=1 Tax=Candidatus Zinderia endosymbiont of Aphrophora alni TaxID=3077951 RepID=UPI0030D2DCE9